MHGHFNGRQEQALLLLPLNTDDETRENDYASVSFSASPSSLIPKAAVIHCEKE